MLAALSIHLKVYILFVRTRMVRGRDCSQKNVHLKLVEIFCHSMKTRKATGFVFAFYHVDVSQTDGGKRFQSRPGVELWKHGIFDWCHQRASFWIVYQQAIKVLPQWLEWRFVIVVTIFKLYWTAGWSVMKHILGEWINSQFHFPFISWESLTVKIFPLANDAMHHFISIPGNGCW